MTPTAYLESIGIDTPVGCVLKLEVADLILLLEEYKLIIEKK